MNSSQLVFSNIRHKPPVVFGSTIPISVVLSSNWSHHDLQHDIPIKAIFLCYVLSYYLVHLDNVYLEGRLSKGTAAQTSTTARKGHRVIRSCYQKLA